MPPLPGEVWMADLGLAAKTRPVVIVSRDDPDPPRALVLYVPLTRQHRQSPYEVVLPSLSFLDRGSVANVQGLGSLPIVRLERRLGTLPDEVMATIKHALAFALDLRAEAERHASGAANSRSEARAEAIGRRLQALVRRRRAPAPRPVHPTA